MEGLSPVLGEHGERPRSGPLGGAARVDAERVRPLVGFCGHPQRDTVPDRWSPKTGSVDHFENPLPIVGPEVQVVPGFG